MCSPQHPLQYFSDSKVFGNSFSGLSAKGPSKMSLMIHLLHAHTHSLQYHDTHFKNELFVFLVVSFSFLLCTSAFLLNASFYVHSELSSGYGRKYRLYRQRDPAANVVVVGMVVAMAWYCVFDTAKGSDYRYFSSGSPGATLSTHKDSLYPYLLLG